MFGRTVVDREGKAWQKIKKTIQYHILFTWGCRKILIISLSYRYLECG